MGNSGEKNEAQSQIDIIRARIDRHRKDAVESSQRIDFEGLERDYREWAKLSKQFGDPAEEGMALARLSLLIADYKPLEAIDCARVAEALADGTALKADVEEARARAYWALGDGVRAKQHLAKVESLAQISRESEESVARWARLASVTRGNVVPTGEPIDVRKENVVAWLRAKSQISTEDLPFKFGSFVSNDPSFAQQATNLLELLTRRLKTGLIKPDNYLLLADPGSGKSFFVKQFEPQLRSRSHDVVFLERNLSAYTSINEAFTDIVMDIVISRMAGKTVILFVDEVDTQLDGKHIFQRLIAPMNGDPFFFLQKQLSFSRQNLVVFYALSSKEDEIKEAQKWPDFLSRIPNAHRVALPPFNSVVDRIYRAVGSLPRQPYKLSRVHAQAQLYIGLREWTSSRELEQSMEFGKVRTTGDPRALELANIATSEEDIEIVSKQTGIDIFAACDHVIEII